MKHRLIFPGIASLRESQFGWFIVVKMGQQEFSFLCGDKPPIASPAVNVVLEYQVADAEQAPMDNNTH